MGNGDEESGIGYAKDLNERKGNLDEKKLLSEMASRIAVAYQGSIQTTDPYTIAIKSVDVAKAILDIVKRK